MAEPFVPNVLVVDDNALDRALLKIHLERDGFAPAFAPNGLEALHMLEKDTEAFDVVLLDRKMPEMDGLQLLARMKEHPRLRMIPVILQTAFSAEHEIIEGIRAGAYYYLTKPYNATMLLTVVRTAAADYAEYKDVRSRLKQGLSTLRLLRHATFSIRTLAEARDLGTVLAYTCPDPATAVIGLTELLLNAVEHGNLGITYDEKSTMERRDWQVEVERRLALPEHAGKLVDVEVERTADRVRFTIRDQGSGFDWQRFLEVDPSRAFDTHGRGIAIARRMSFDSLEYAGCGNTVVATVLL
jgi:CheY-like chemotaxis protein/anti-sigma regulatory factor (Ser/Thr protein kinase)